MTNVATQIKDSENYGMIVSLKKSIAKYINSVCKHRSI